jgi:hypothetical protein
MSFCAIDLVHQTVDSHVLLWTPSFFKFGGPLDSLVQKLISTPGLLSLYILYILTLLLCFKPIWGPDLRMVDSTMALRVHPRPAEVTYTYSQLYTSNIVST